VSTNDGILVRLMSCAYWGNHCFLLMETLKLNEFFLAENRN